LKYMVMVYLNESAEAARPKEDFAKVAAAWKQYTTALQEAGLDFTPGTPVQPSSTATTIRVRDGQVSVQDGPIAETKEQFASSFTIDCPDLDAALSWAKIYPGAEYGAVEVRPVLCWQQQGLDRE